VSPDVHVRHAIPGRARLRVEHFTPADLDAVEAAIGRWPDARDVQVNRRTGSVLVWHTGSLESLRAWAREAGAFRLATEATRAPPHVLESATEGLERVDRIIDRRSRGAWNLRTAGFAGLAAVAVIQALRGHWFGPASSVLGLGLSVLSLSRRSVGLSSEPGEENEP